MGCEYPDMTKKQHLKLISVFSLADQPDKHDVCLELPAISRQSARGYQFSPWIQRWNVRDVRGIEPMFQRTLTK